MLLSDFNFHLPQDLIAQSPLPDRAASRMLSLERHTGRFYDKQFADFPVSLRPGDLVVFNNTRVFPARLLGRRSGNRAQSLSQRNPATREFLTGQVEVLLTRQIAEMTWHALVRPGKKIGVGEKIFFGHAGGPQLVAEVIAREDFGERTLRFELPPGQEFFANVDRLGHVPLPPYIDRIDSQEDRERYQTVFAKETGSVAAPTAGLHFTPEVLQSLNKAGIEMAHITLHVGLGTFQPARNQKVEENILHCEQYSISPDAAEQINNAKRDGRRVVAIGTTTVRTLEHVASANDGRIIPGSGETHIFIYSGFRFQIIDALLTNFHLPQSTLLMLVSAFAGRENILRAYEHAVHEKYRFFSYGDCMLIH